MSSSVRQTNEKNQTNENANVATYNDPMKLARLVSKARLSIVAIVVRSAEEEQHRQGHALRGCSTGTERLLLMVATKDLPRAELFEIFGRLGDCGSVQADFNASVSAVIGVSGVIQSPRTGTTERVVPVLRGQHFVDD
jgi:hypothetical protein